MKYDTIDTAFPSLPHPFDFGAHTHWLQETWPCVCGARHLGKRRVIEKVDSIPYSSYHAPRPA